MKIKNGPREKLIKTGISSLTDEEILAILLKTGSKELNVLELSKNILDDISNIGMLNDYTYEELMKYNGIGRAKSMTILCAIELGNRIRRRNINLKTIKCPKDIYNYLKYDLTNIPNEKSYCVFLNANYKILSKYLLSSGFSNMTEFNSKEIVKRALKLNSCHIAIAHNHPSGTLTPSKADESSIRVLERLLWNFDIDLLDSVIVTDQGYYSMKFGYKADSCDIMDDSEKRN